MKDPVEQWLPTAFAVLRQQWAYDFLFSEDEPLLHNALVNGERVAGTFALNTDPTLPMSSPCDLDEQGSMLFFSAFNRDVYTAGYEVTHRAKSAQSINTNHRYISRVIRDDATASLFTVARHHHLQLTEVTFCRPQTPGYRFQAMLMFRTDAFDQMIRQAPHHFDARAARDALVMSFCTSEWRQCPLCASYNSQMCGCPLQNRLKHGAQDRHHDYDSLLIHSGAFNGLVNINMYTQPGAPPFIQKSTRAHSFIAVKTDYDKQHSLAAWAMQHVSQNKPLNLLRLIAPQVFEAPPAAQQNEQPICTTATDISLDLDDPLSFLDHVDMSMIVHADSEISRQLDVSDASKNVAQDVTQGVQGVSHEQDPSLQLLDCSDVNAVSFLSTSSDIADEVVPLVPPQCNSVISDSTCLVDVARVDDALDVTSSDAQAETSSHLCKEASDASPSTAQSALAQVAQLVHAPPVRAEEDHHTSDETMVRHMSRAVAIAPAIDGRAQNKLDMPDANQIKIERRKARNRASAQRSNLKKKLAAQKLKDELSALCEKEDSLRQRERQLREENIKLRSAIPK